MFDWLALDPRTLLLVAPLLVVLNAAALALLLPSLAEELRPSARSWGLGILMQALSGLTFALQGDLEEWVPERVLVVSAHAFALVGMTWYVHALRQFHSLPSRSLVLLPALAGTLAIALGTALGAGLAWRILCTSASLTVLLLVGIRSLSTPGPLFPRVSRRVLQLALMVLAVAVGLRALQAWLDPPQATTLIDIDRGSLVLQLLLMSALPMVGTSAFFAMCSERMRMRWESAAATDFLTGLPNRRNLVEVAEDAILEARAAAFPLSLAVIDIDHFKHLNDRLGHAAGDAALKHLARHLRTLCGERELPARAGGEEFCIVARGHDREGAGDLLTKLQRQMGELPFEWQGQYEPLTFSAGVSELCPDDGGFDSLFGRADQALYLAKRGGRDRIVIAPPIEAGIGASVLVGK